MAAKTKFKTLRPNTTHRALLLRTGRQHQLFMRVCVCVCVVWCPVRFDGNVETKMTSEIPHITSKSRKFAVLEGMLQFFFVPLRGRIGIGWSDRCCCCHGRQTGRRSGNDIGISWCSPIGFSVRWHDTKVLLLLLLQCKAKIYTTEKVILSRGLCVASGGIARFEARRSPNAQEVCVC
jgi:hypothetical protein